MKAKIKTCTNPHSFMEWWYSNHIGEVFEVEPDPEQKEYYLTNIPGSPHKHGILKSDCEVIEEVSA
jgi:hypothetical protein